MTVVRRHDLTADEFTTISERYGPHDVLEEFWTGYDAYWDDNDRYSCPHDYHSVPGQAWNAGADAAMYVRWERKMPARDMYERDDRETELQIAACRRVAEKRKKRAATAANDN
jgi:hypothetical protein